ncbi:MAG: hypothetical protein HKN51_09420 [Saprospiraceae bacterium]|nr:hypothetical protein [Saprospiraceae bacterium]
MNKYFIYLICLFAFLQCKVSQPQPVEEKPVQQYFEFPFEWVGHYKGKLDIYKENGEATEINMELLIEYPNSEGYYPWTIIYNEKDFRKYGLEVVNPEKGHYRIDEFNSIRIDGYLNEGHFVSRFEVGGNDLLVDYHKTNEGMEVHFYISKTEPISITGNEIFSTDTIPEVKTYPIFVFQKALLLKI